MFALLIAFGTFQASLHRLAKYPIILQKGFPNVPFWAEDCAQADPRIIKTIRMDMMAAYRVMTVTRARV